MLDPISCLLVEVLCAVLVPLVYTRCLHARLDRSAGALSCHGVLAVGMVIPMLFGWQKLVAESWGLANFVLLDEVVLMLPGLVSYALINYLVLKSRLHNSPDFEDSSTEQPSIESILSTQLKLDLVAVLLPAITLIAVGDFLRQVNWSEGQAMLALLTGLLVLLCVFPFIFSRVMGLEPITDPEALARLTRICAKLGVKKIKLMRWDNDNLAANAFLLGVFPWGRRLVVTEQLIKDFDQSLDSIVGHEVAHLNRAHLWWRALSVGAPLIVMATAIVAGVWTFPKQPLDLAGFSLPVSILVVPVYLLYVFLTLAILAPLMEHEADLVSDELSRKSGRLPGHQDQQELGPTPMAFALQSLGHSLGGQFTTRTWLHPSLLDRIVLVNRAAFDPTIPNRVYGKLRLVKAMILILNLLLLGFLFLA